MSENIEQMRMGRGKSYSDERNIQILISLLKANGIRRVVVSPGATNVTFVGSLQYDPYFEMYSCLDERSAAYMALGMAEECGEPVVLSCTGATSSREYMPALTAAYYHKLPVLAVTSSQISSRIGQMVAQVTDRRNPPKDAVVASFQLESVNTKDDEWDRTVKANEALSCLTRNGGGPVHINLVTTYSKDFSVKTLPFTKRIIRIDPDGAYPQLSQGRIGVFIGSHQTFSAEQTKALDDFCASNDAVVFCSHCSGYYGRYRVQNELAFMQKEWSSFIAPIDLLIHIGNITGDYTISAVQPKQVWRVDEDGTIRDLLHKLTYVFNMSATSFFQHYTSPGAPKSSLLQDANREYEYVHSLIPELPFGNIWLAQQTSLRFPAGSVVHFGILNSFRSWNMFRLSDGVESQSNVGGFGIDGTVSSLIGASLADKNRLHFGVFGDLSFFYDMNVAASGLVGNNVRLLIVNNGLGAEFRLYNHPANAFGEAANPYMAAAGHNGNKSQAVMRDYVTDLGFEYLTASSKEEYLQNMERFLSPSLSEKPILFEVFTSSDDESESLRIMEHLAKDTKMLAKKKIGSFAKTILGEDGYDTLKKTLMKSHT